GGAPRHGPAAPVRDLLGLSGGGDPAPHRRDEEPRRRTPERRKETAMRIGSRIVTFAGLFALSTLAASASSGEQAVGVLEAPGTGLSAHAYFSPTASTGLARQPWHVVAWLDLSRAPLIVSTPDTGRHYVLPMLDMWTGVFASPGSQISGTRASNFLVALPSWQGPVPAGVERINSPTPYVWIIGPTEPRGTPAADAARRVQAGYKVTSLSEWATYPMTVTVDITSLLGTSILKIADAPEKR